MQDTALCRNDVKGKWLSDTILPSYIHTVLYPCLGESEDFSKPKIVWGNLNLKPSYAIVEDNSFINAPSPMIVPASRYLLAILNSKLADYFIRQLGVTRNGGYFEYKPMFIEKLPVPQCLDDSILKEIDTNVAIKNEKIIDTIVYSLYGLNDKEIQYIEKGTQENY